MNKTIQAKDITDEQMLYLIDKTKTERNIWTTTWDFEMYYPMLPRKVMTAKLKSMMKRGLVDGCACGCRGDWERVPVISKEEHLNQGPLGIMVDGLFVPNSAMTAPRGGIKWGEL